MIANPVHARFNVRSRLAVARLALAAAVVSIVGTSDALAYVGNSYLQIPGTVGNWQGAQYKNWIKIDAQYWKTGSMALAGFPRRSRTVFSGPGAPRHGAGSIVIALDKKSPVLAGLMDKCVHKAAIPEANYAESTDRARSVYEMGPRPAGIPEYFEYRLKNVELSDCPVVADAPQQAFVVTFKDIEWLNYQAEGNSVAFKLQPAALKTSKNSGKTKAFVLTWFGMAHDVSDNQCPVLNVKPLEPDYYALMSKEDADKERALLAGKGGVNYQNGQMGRRGPHKLDVALLPGIVPDPGHAEPQTKVARGFDLDGNDGSGKPPPGVCKHKNYVSEDGRTGIDNQLYTVEGCIAGFQGHKGFQMQFANNQMHDGQMAILVEISGIDNEQNDRDVEVRLLYSLDPMAKSASGSEVLADSTFRLTDNPEYSHYFTQVHGRIVNGVVSTDPVKDLRMNLGTFNSPFELKLVGARMRLELRPDGTVKGVLGGYRDWHEISSTYINSSAEMYMGFQQPALYNSLKRNADGLKDKVTGECNGISTAYDMEGVPAFIEPAQPNAQPPAKSGGQLPKADATAPKVP